MTKLTGYRLINAESKDLPAVRDFLESCQLPSQDITKEHLQHFFLVTLDTKIVGTVGLEIYADNGLLRSLAVRKNLRGKGLGKLLVEQIELHAEDLGISDIYLLTTTADYFFQNLGYDRVSREDVPEAVLDSNEFSQICPSSAISMKKILCRCG